MKHQVDKMMMMMPTTTTMAMTAAMWVRDKAVIFSQSFRQQQISTPL